MNYAAARENMVESQVRPNGITDRRIIEAMAAIAREDFVPESRKAVAYADEDIALTAGASPRYLVEAMAFARLVQLAAIKPGDKVLHVGAATGYGSAVLSRLAAEVVALESDPGLAAEARRNLEGTGNVRVVAGAFAEGARAEAPFDVILVEGRAGELPAALMSQVAGGGRIVAVIGENDVAKAHLWTASGQILACRTAFDATIAPLPGLEKRKAAFQF